MLFSSNLTILAIVYNYTKTSRNIYIYIYIYIKANLENNFKTFIVYLDVFSDIWIINDKNYVDECGKVRFYFWVEVVNFIVCNPILKVISKTNQSLKRVTRF